MMYRDIATDLLEEICMYMNTLLKQGFKKNIIFYFYYLTTFKRVVKCYSY